MLLRLFHIKEGELSLGSNDPYNEGIRYILQGEYGKAVGFFDRLLSVKNSDRVQPNLFKGMAHFLEIKPSYEEAQQCFLDAATYLFDQRDALEKQRKAPNLESEKLLALAMTGLGYCLFMQGQFQKALESFNEALKFDLECVDAHLGNSLVLQFLGYTNAARKCSEAAEILQPNNVFVLNTRANALLLSGKLEDARPYFLALHAKAKSIDKTIFDKIRAVYGEYTDLENPLYVYPDGGAQETRPGARWEKARVKPGYETEADNAKQKAKELLNLLAQRRQQLLAQEAKLAGRRMIEVPVAPNAIEPKKQHLQLSDATIVEPPISSLQISPVEVHVEIQQDPRAERKKNAIASKKQPVQLADAANVGPSISSLQTSPVQVHLDIEPVPKPKPGSRALPKEVKIDQPQVALQESTAFHLEVPSAPEPEVKIPKQESIPLTLDQLLERDVHFRVFYQTFLNRLNSFARILSNKAAGFAPQKGTLEAMGSGLLAIISGIGSAAYSAIKKRMENGQKNNANDTCENVLYKPSKYEKFLDELAAEIIYRYSDQIKRLTLLDRDEDEDDLFLLL